MPIRIPHLLAVAFLWSSPALATQSHESVNRSLAEHVIMPAYVAYRDAMAALPGPIETLCADPTDRNLDAARGAYRLAMNRWQRVQPVAFGPVVSEGVLSRIQFWPDKHGTAGRQLRRALQASDPALIAGGLEGKSAALQSLTALELLLFDAAPAADLADRGKPAFACALALEIARYQESVAARVLAAWQGKNGYYHAFTHAAAGNELFFDDAEAATALFRAVTSLLDRIVVQKLEAPLGESLGKARPKQAEAWRSDLSLPAIIANLETVHALYTTTGGLGSWLAAEEHQELEQALRQRLERVRSLSTAIRLPLTAAIVDPTERRLVEELAREVKALAMAFGNDLGSAAGLTIGFNSTDGD